MLQQGYHANTMVGFEEILSAAARIKGVAHRTPVATSRTLDGMLAASFHLKCENFQRMGAFKFRGAYNAISRLKDEERGRGILTYSSGNHAQAVALASRILGASATIVMPSNAPTVKRRATEGYGARIIFYDPAKGSREEVAAGLQGPGGPVLIPPFDHPHIVAGQGTGALELIEDAGELDILLVPCGGGGLLSGSAIAAKHMSPGCRVFGVEPAGADDATRSFHTGTLQRCEDPRTIADGARTPSLGPLTFSIIKARVDEMVTVTDTEIVTAMRFLWERMKLVVEPTGALGLAAALAGRVPVRGLRVGVILSGGNVDLVYAADLFRQ